jgi:hypothetical protein
MPVKKELVINTGPLLIQAGEKTAGHRMTMRENHLTRRREGAKKSTHQNNRKSSNPPASTQSSRPIRRAAPSGAAFDLFVATTAPPFVEPSDQHRYENPPPSGDRNAARRASPFLLTFCGA